jgi:hypothetical protein
MRIYTVHLGPARQGARERDIRFVKEGFSWPAALFSLFWALAKRMWVTAIAIFLAQALVSGIIQAATLSPEADTAVSVAFLFLLGTIANDLVRFELARRGYREVGVVAGRNLASAEQRAFERIPALA